ncbi:MAG: signal peptidase I [Acidobacteria bacterium]|nr:signal peptidase I [Acidobacteriota bacterium]MBV9071556.1 signal peptidase I [Acidobacteriota bacterium]MBV9187809.1 signal peptidase I [Acidobacteriota bacterium]
MGTGAMICWIVIVLLVVIGMWKVFVKAGKPGWAAIIPIYNMIVLLEIAGKPLWWIILLLIPFVNFIVAIILLIAVARNFGKGIGFALGLLLLPFIFYPILGFGDARYQPVAA